MDKMKGNLKKLNGSHLVPIEEKSHQFFGATVRSNDKHDKIVVGLFCGV